MGYKNARIPKQEVCLDSFDNFLDQFFRLLQLLVYMYTYIMYSDQDMIVATTTPHKQQLLQLLRLLLLEQKEQLPMTTRLTNKG